QGATVIGDLTYTYDQVGRRTVSGGTFARTGLPQAVSTATYNAANQQLALGNKSLTFDANGNFNYGATGTAAGFPESVLLREAGRVQQAADTSKSEWGDPGSRFNPWGGTPPYGDDPVDQEFIKKGIEYCR